MPIEYKRKITHDVRHKSFHYIGDRRKGGFVYKYMTTTTLLASLQSKSLRFSQPCFWKDKYESLYYNADYDTLLKAPQETHPSLYAYCVTTAKECEPSWRMYGTQNDPVCVQVKLNLTKFFDALQYCGADYEFYVGNVCYDLENHHLHVLGKRTYQRMVKGVMKSYKVKGHDALFRNFDLASYLNLLLFKRKAFSYEQEMRIFAIPRNPPLEESHDFPIDLTGMIEEIRCPAEFNEQKFNDLKTKLVSLGIPADIISMYDIQDCKVKTSSYVVEP